MGAVRQQPLPTVTDSLDRVVDAAQHVMGNQMELLRLDVVSAVTSALARAALVLGGVALIAIGWVVLLMAAYRALEPSAGPLLALAILGGVNVVGGVVMLAEARRSGTEAERG